MTTKEQIHQSRMKRWPRRFQCFLLRLALGRDTFDYMLRSIRNDKRTPAARLVDIVVRQDAREVRTEADWIKKIAQMTYHLPTPSLIRKPWYRRLWCALDGHGGITPFNGPEYVPGDDHFCKRCGATVRLVG